MKILRISIIVLILLLVAPVVRVIANTQAQVVERTATLALQNAPIQGQTAYPAPRTSTPTRAPTINVTKRPIVVIESYYFDQDTIKPGDSFNLYLSIKNQGEQEARNLIFTFSGGDFSPQETGGVKAVGSLGANSSGTLSQQMLASASLWGKTTGTVTVNLKYDGERGEAFSESFVLTIEVLGWSGDWKTATPTPTATGIPRAQLVISGYRSDVDPLQPGSIFNLDMDVRNLGGGAAHGVTMVLGGGSNGSSSNADGTPQPGGVAGGGADLTTFAPLGSSNVQFLADIASDASIHVTQKLIANVSANPGAYTLKLSFLYSDAKGNRQVDDQIITLLVYQLPQVEVNFYRDAGPIGAGQPNILPIQVVNLGRKAAVMGNMKVTAENAELTNNVGLVGPLDPGGYFPLDVNLIPKNPGPLKLNITINYTDDFNQARLIEQTLQVEVLEGMPSGGPGGEQGPGLGPDGKPIQPGTGPDGMNPGGPGVVGGVSTEESTWDKIIRFLKGLFGLDSAVPQPDAPPGGPGENPKPGEQQPVPVKPLG